MTQVANVVRVWPDGVPGADASLDVGPELERPRRENSRLVRNVTEPTLTVFLPEASVAVGTGVVVCPGGAWHFLMMDKEGTEVARWLTARGVAAFVLKYRLAPTPDDDDAFTRAVSNLDERREQMAKARPLAVADGLQAVRVVRQRADEWGLEADRIGILGFSAGGAATAGAATRYDAESRPSFAAPIYAPWWDTEPVPADVPPLFLAAAGDDVVVDPDSSLKLYSAWRGVGRPAELHMYSKGGHGFGMNQQGLPSDHWIDQFWAWLQASGFATRSG
jgi:acetyl esterase/lipase